MDTFRESDLKEIFALFTSVTRDELSQIYDVDNRHHFENENLDDEYQLSQAKREFSLDCLRSVLYFLTNHGYTITKNDEHIDTEYVLGNLFAK